MNALVFIMGHAYSWRGLNAVSCQGRMGTDKRLWLSLVQSEPKKREKSEKKIVV
jgi:hypothetical protein